MGFAAFPTPRPRHFRRVDPVREDLKSGQRSRLGRVEAAVSAIVKIRRFRHSALEMP
jgi:hypothetical protein